MKNLCSILVVLAVACISVSFCISIPGLSFHATGGKVEAAYGGDMYSFRLVKLQEMKNATHMVVENSPQKHKYEFQTVAFNVGPTTTTNATAKDAETQSTFLSASVDVGNDKTIDITIAAHLYLGNGIYTFADPKVVGQARVAFDVRGWPFCSVNTNECNNNGTLETGAFLDATFEVASPGHISVNQSTLTAKFGDNAEMTWPKEIDYASVVESQDTGFPMVSVGIPNKLSMIIRFRKFEASAYYGAVQLNFSLPSAAGKVASGIASLLAVFVAVLIC